MQGFLDINYKLNPNEYELDASSSATGTGVTIDSLIGDSPVDPALQKDYREKIQALSDDEPSKEIKNIMEDDLWQWHEQLTYEDIKEIDRTLYKSEHPMADIYYEMSPYLVIKNAIYTDGAHYNPAMSGIYINMEEDRDPEAPRGAYNVFFHEMGHMIDNTLPEVIKGQWTNWYHGPYVSTGYSQYSDEFYNNLISDVENYRDNYNEIHGTDYSENRIVEEIKKELGENRNSSYAGRISEFSDLYGGVTGNKLKGNYGHDDDYWKPDKNGKPASNGPLNKEAFAHFTEISVMQNARDIDNMEKYFPTAYETYEKMVDEMEGKLNDSRV